MKRETWLISGAAAIGAAFLATQANNEVAGVDIPSWINQFAGIGGIISVIIGFLQKKDPPVPNPSPDPTPTPAERMTFIQLYQKAMANNGKIGIEDIPLFLEFFKSQGQLLPNVTPLDPNGLPIVGPVNPFVIPNNLPGDFAKYKIIFEQIMAIIATNKEVKDKGMPKYINAVLVWDATTVFPFVIGIDPRPPAPVPAPTVAPLVPSITPVA